MGKNWLKISNHNCRNTEEEIKSIIETMYYCLKNYEISCPKFHVLKKEYYDKDNSKELKKEKYMLCILDETFVDYRTLKSHISDSPKSIKDKFRNHIPFSFEYKGSKYYYNGNGFFRYEELFPLDYIKEVAEDISSRGHSSNNSILVLEEFDDLGDNNDSYYICIKEFNDKWYISSFEQFSSFFYCHEYIDEFFEDDSIDNSLYMKEDTVLFTYNSSELEEILNFEVIQIYE